MPRPKKQPPVPDTAPVQSTTPSPEDQKAIARLDLLTITAEEETGEVQANFLTLRQQAFVLAITGPAFMNQAKAAEMAGYNSANRQNLHLCANRNMNNPWVRKAIEQIMRRKGREDPDWMDNEVYALATTSMADCGDYVFDPVTGEATGFKLNWQKIMESGAISAATDVSVDPDTQKVIGFHMPSASERLKALELSAKLAGRMKDTAPDGGPSQINLNITLVRDVPRKELPPVITNPIGDVHVENEEPPGLRIIEPGAADGQ